MAISKPGILARVALPQNGTAYGIVMPQPLQVGMTGHVNETGLAKLAEDRDVAVSRLHVNTLITSSKEDYT